MKKCNEVMTKNPLCCLPEDLVTKAAKLMKSEHIGSIPVIENEQTKKLVGIVTDPVSYTHLTLPTNREV